MYFKLIVVKWIFGCGRLFAGIIFVCLIGVVCSVLGRAEDLSGTTSAVADSRADAESALMDATGVQELGANSYKVGLVRFDTKARTVIIPATVNMVDQVVEYALVASEGKTHESVFVTDARPVDVHLACLMLGVKSTNIVAEFEQPMSIPVSNRVEIRVQWRRNGPNADYLLSKMVASRKSIGSDAWHNPPKNSDSIGEIKVWKARDWFYKGSCFRAEGFMAQFSGSIVATIDDPMALMINSGGDRSRRLVQHYPNKKLLPKVGASVALVLQFCDLLDQSNLTDRSDQQGKGTL